MMIVEFPKKIISFLKEVKTEVKKINWPTKKEVLRYTFMILVISFVLAIFLGGLDYLFTLFVKFIL